MPVLPLVASMSAAPGRISPRFSAPTTMESAGRSFTEHAGLFPSSLASRTFVVLPGMRCRRASGVLPTNWSRAGKVMSSGGRNKSPALGGASVGARVGILLLLLVVLLLLLVGFLLHLVSGVLLRGGLGVRGLLLRCGLGVGGLLLGGALCVNGLLLGGGLGVGGLLLGGGLGIGSLFLGLGLRGIAHLLLHDGFRVRRHSLHGGLRVGGLLLHYGLGVGGRLFHGGLGVGGFFLNRGLGVGGFVLDLLLHSLGLRGNSRGAREADVLLHLLERGVADAVHLLHVLERLEVAVLGAVLDDGLRLHRAHAVEAL